MRRILLATLLIVSSAAAQTATCSNQSAFDPTKPGQVTICDPVPPGPACLVSSPGSSTVCRINGVANISENGSAFRPLFSPPVDVFRFYAPTNLPLTASTSYYIGSLIAGGHNPDMVYMVPNACTLTKVVYDTRSSGPLSGGIAISLWNVTKNIAIPNASTTQSWTSWSVETVATPSFALLAGDQLQVRLTMPSTLPKGFYANMTVTAYCIDN